MVIDVVRFEVYGAAALQRGLGLLPPKHVLRIRILW
jgi:hypothetical protein